MNAAASGATSARLSVDVLGIGLLGPGLGGWDASRAVLAGAQPWLDAPVVVPPPARLPPAERRRAGAATKLALAVADEACAASGLDAASMATVFVSADGDAANCHALCEALALPERLVSPTRFTNSVHNATAGYWHIALGSRQPSTSLAAWQAGAGAALLEAASQARRREGAVLLVCADLPPPPPLAAKRAVHATFAFAMVLRHARDGRADTGRRLHLAVQPEATGAGDASGVAAASIETLAAQAPAARAMPLLQALAQPDAGSVRLAAWPGLAVQVSVDAPVDAAGDVAPRARADR